MVSEKPHRIRMKVRDAVPRKPNKLKGLVPHVDVHDVANGLEFVICAVKEAHLEEVRVKLGPAGLEEMPGGDTNVSPPPPKPARRQGKQDMGQEQRPKRSNEVVQPLKPKPYGFVPLPNDFTTKPPVWHDGTHSAGRLSGEIRCEIETLTPLLVGWERRAISDSEELWPIRQWPASGDDLDAFLNKAARQEHPDDERPDQQRKVDRARRDYIDRVRGNVVEIGLSDVGRTIGSKSILCPLRAPWGDRPVLLPGDSLKGLLRHELGALLGAPMERVAERSYSYRPNSLFPNDPNPRLVPRLARVVGNAVEMRPLEPGDANTTQIRVPIKLDLLPANLKYDKKHAANPPRYRFDAGGGSAYRGGLGAGEPLNSKRRLHTSVEVTPNPPPTTVPVPEVVQNGYVNTIRHLADLVHGHFSERHPDVPNVVGGEEARRRILEAASTVVFSPDDLIWVEWDTREKCIVSLGWHYYYRWAYADTVRKEGWTRDRHGLYPRTEEKTVDDNGVPQGLSAVRRLFGYTGDNEGSRGIGKNDHQQLMGRLSVNAAIEVIDRGDTDETRFLPPTFLKELGMPRPSAVEHYLDQPHHPKPRPSDRATLVTYGDAAGYDGPGRLAGRKFYLDRKDAYTGEPWKDAYTDEPWKDDSEANRLNDRSTLALEASCRGRRFRFTVRFRDLDPNELAAILVALCPHQFRDVLGGEHADGYCSKLGYARPLGWGSVRIETKALLWLDTLGDEPALTPTTDPSQWLREHITPMPIVPQRWLAIHRRNHPDAADYHSGHDRNIYSYHAKLRADHSRARRYDREGKQ